MPFRLKCMQINPKKCDFFFFFFVLKKKRKKKGKKRRKKKRKEKGGGGGGGGISQGEKMPKAFWLFKLACLLHSFEDLALNPS